MNPSRKIAVRFAIITASISMVIAMVSVFAGDMSSPSQASPYSATLANPAEPRADRPRRSFPQLRQNEPVRSALVEYGCEVG